MRHPKPEWVAELKKLCGPLADIRFNEALYRWEFLIPGADGVPRSQFWGWFNQPADPQTGLHPFRELDDAAMREALHNLTVTFVGSTEREFWRRHDHNEAIKAKSRKRRAEDYEYYITKESRRQIKGHPLVPVLVDL